MTIELTDEEDLVAGGSTTLAGVAVGAVTGVEMRTGDSVAQARVRIRTVNMTKATIPLCIGNPLAARIRRLCHKQPIPDVTTRGARRPVLASELGLGNRLAAERRYITVSPLGESSQGASFALPSPVYERIDECTRCCNNYGTPPVRASLARRPLHRGRLFFCPPRGPMRALRPGPATQRSRS